MAEKQPSQLHLNPGPKPRKSMSGWKCMFWTLLVAVLLVVAWMISIIVRGMVEVSQSPHQYAYANKTLDEVKHRATVIQPLVDMDTTFDVGVTVWARDEIIAENPSAALRHEKIIFSDVVFSGLSMKDAQTSKLIKFDLPLAPFRAQNLTNYDVRASFVLMPQSPSLLDHLKNASSWYPASITVPPVQHRSELAQSELSLREQAIDMFGISMPLIHLHSINSRCLSEDPEAQDYDDEDDYEDDDDVGKKKTSSTTDSSTEGEESAVDHASALLDASSGLKTTLRKKPTEAHPYLITRTQIRLIRETRLYDRKQYNRAHKKLKNRACGQGVPNVTPSWYMCGRDFNSHGNFETRLELDMGNNKTEWAYAPFLIPYNRGPGRKDFVPLPVNREGCSATENYDAEFMPVEWNLHFATVSPRMHFFGDSMSAGNGFFNHSDTEHEQLLAHDQAELTNGLFGHHYREGAHPRRRFALGAVMTVLMLLSTVLDVHYWYTRKTTFGLSTLAFLLLPSEFFINQAASTAKGYTNWDSAMISFLLASLLNPVAYLQLKTITRADFGWRNGGWIPWITFAQASHRERVSQRADATFSRNAKIAMILGTIAFYYLLEPQELVVFLTSSYPRQPPTGPAYQRNATSIARALVIIGRTCQRLLNHRLKVFAGRYKLTVGLSVLTTALAFANHSDILVGSVEIHRGITLDEILLTVLLGVTVWQAWVYPKVAQDEEEGGHIQ